PYLIAYEMTNAVNNNTIVGNISAHYTISDKFDVMVRSGIATSSEFRQQRRPYSSANFLKGYYKEQDIDNYEVNTDALVSYTEKIGQHIDLKISGGANTMRQKFRGVESYVTGLVIPG